MEKDAWGRATAVEWWVQGEQRQKARKGNTEKRARGGLPCPYIWLLLDAEPGGGVLGKDLAQTYASGERVSTVLCPVLFHHHKFADPVHRGLGDAAGPEQKCPAMVLVFIPARATARFRRVPTESLWRPHSDRRP